MTKQETDLVPVIRAIMKRHEFTQEMTARYLGVPPGTLGNWLAYTRKPAASVHRLIEVLGLVEALAPGIHATLMPEDKS